MSPAAVGEGEEVLRQGLQVSGYYVISQGIGSVIDDGKLNTDDLLVGKHSQSH